MPIEFITEDLELCYTSKDCDLATVESAVIPTTCNQNIDPRIPFTREEALDTFLRGCGTSAFDRKLIRPMKASIFEGSKNLTMHRGWSEDQSRREKRTDDMFSHKDFTDWFTAAMDNCNLNSRTEKWGSKTILSGEKGCIDIELSGAVRH